MKFYDCSTAPSPRRVRIFIAEKGIAIPTVEVNLREREQMGPDFAKINPYLTVPVLELDDGTRLLSTQGCWRYLEAVYPDPPLMGRDAKEQAVIADREWRCEMEGFMAVGEALRNSTPRMAGRALTGRYEYEQIPALAERGMARVPRFFDDLDRILADSEFIAGDSYSVADITAFVAVEFAGWLKLGFEDRHSHARRWYAAMKARPGSVK